MSEREYKKKGDELAELAVKNGFASKQLRDIFSYLNTKPLPMVESHIERQIGRSLTGEKDRVLRGYDVVGEHLRELIEEYRLNKHGLKCILRHANMTYPYFEAKQKSGTHREHIGTKSVSGHRTKAEPRFEKELRELIKNKCSEYGFGDIRVSSEGDGYLVNVTLRRFRGNPAALARELYGEAVRQIPELSHRVRFWIDKR